MWVPLTKNLARLHGRFILDLQNGTSGNSVILQLTSPRIENGNLTITVQHDGVTTGVSYIPHTSKFYSTRLLTLPLILFGLSIGNTTNMEGTHRQLRTRFTNTLSRNNTDSHSFFDFRTGRHIHAVTFATNTQGCFTRHRTANLDLFETHLLNLPSNLRSNHLILSDNHLISHRVNNVLSRNTTINSSRQTDFHLFTTVNNTLGNTLCGIAFIHRNDDILCHIGKFTRQVTRVGRFERRISQTFSSTVG